MIDITNPIFISLFGVLLTIIGYYAYIKDIYLGKTKPHFFSWFIWGILTIIVFFIQYYEGGGIGTWVTATTGIITLFIAFFALGNKNNNIVKSDWISFSLALLTLPLWFFTENPLYSLLLIVFIDALGYIPTVRKSWNDPYSETLLHHFISGIKFIPAIVTLENFIFLTYFYPFFLLIANLSFCILLLLRRKKIKNPAKSILKPCEFKYEKINISNELNLLIPNWDSKIIKYTTKNAKKISIDPYGPTSFEDENIPPLSYNLVSGEGIKKDLSWLDNLYRTLFYKKAKKFGINILGKKEGKSLVLAKILLSGININMQIPGQRYDIHIDSNPLQGLLFVTDNPEDGALVVSKYKNVVGEKELLSTSPLYIYPKKGDLYFFNAQQNPHYVQEIKKGIRISIPMNFYTNNSPETDRDPDLSKSIGLE